ncbi:MULTISPECIES: hypothetical protein [Acidobacteriaceae]|uniref:hypothetical protein n=1 Tax=Acidobacteriaceae TaxID=204434 RepID=UPI00131D3681|nr:MULTISPECIES: hypothetical protein [Acidobacteriaceae]MDW5266560.1 hypothetical protein [Edaphobacter sp.]
MLALYGCFAPLLVQRISDFDDLSIAHFVKEESGLILSEKRFFSVSSFACWREKYSASPLLCRSRSGRQRSQIKLEKSGIPIPDVQIRERAIVHAGIAAQRYTSRAEAS